MNKPWKVILVLIGIFVAGGVTGAFVMMRLGHRMVSHRPGPEQWAPSHLKRLMQRLELKPEQGEAIRPIVHRHMEDLTRLRTESMADIKRIIERMEREISAQLTPEQRTKFEQLNKEMRERAKKFSPERKNRLPGPGGLRGEREPRSGEPGEPEGEALPGKPPGGG